MSGLEPQDRRPEVVLTLAGQPVTPGDALRLKPTDQGLEGPDSLAFGFAVVCCCGYFCLYLVVLDDEVEFESLFHLLQVPFVSHNDAGNEVHLGDWTAASEYGTIRNFTDLRGL